MRKNRACRPMTFRVQFPILDDPETITQTELNRLINYLRIMSNKDYKFEFEMPQFCRIVQ